MKVFELTGAELDYWVAKANDYNAVVSDGLCWVIDDPDHWERYQPSSDWSHGGRIIEREKIDVEYRARQKQWFAMIELKASLPREWGETCLIAAMRTFVSSHFGDEVPSE